MHAHLDRRAGPVLSEGETCWRIAHADRFALIVDAEGYFLALREAMLRAREAIYLIGWDFDLNIDMCREGDLPDGMPNRLGDFMKAIVQRNPGLHIHILQWDGAALTAIGRQIIPALALEWFARDQIHFNLDSVHPAGACHHQKIVVVDDAIAFCGGIDVTDDRWDTRDHAPGDPRRYQPDGSAYGPWHDATAAVDGDAAKALGELARERWKRAGGHPLTTPNAHAGAWPPRLAVRISDVDVAIARTMPDYEDEEPVREIERLLLRAIACARETIYLENQYFAAPEVADALIARLKEPDGPEVVIVNPQTAETWIESKGMDTARGVLIDRVRRNDPHGRFGIFYPVNAEGEPIYVHAKILIVDECLLRIGSSNLDDRSMGFDTECDLAIEVESGSDAAKAIRLTRDGLVAEHLDVEIEALREAIVSEGSLLAAVKRLCRAGGRSLVALEVIPPTAAELALAESGLFDPKSELRLTDRLTHGLKRLLKGQHVQALFGSALLATALTAHAALRLKRRRD